MILRTTGKRVIVENPADAGYQEALADFNRLNSFTYICCALMCDIEDRHGTVVKALTTASTMSEPPSKR